MKTRVNRNFIYRNEGMDFNTLMVKANMLAYPYFEYEDNIYFVRFGKKNKFKTTLVTQNVEEV
jgi:hypothetical protein